MAASSLTHRMAGTWRAAREGRGRVMEAACSKVMLAQRGVSSALIDKTLQSTTESIRAATRNNDRTKGTTNRC